MNRPGDYLPATPRQSQILNSDIALSHMIEQAIEARDIDLLVDAMAEKRDLERALDASRTESWNTWHLSRIEGDGAA